MKKNGITVCVNCEQNSKKVSISEDKMRKSKMEERGSISKTREQFVSQIATNVSPNITKEGQIDYQQNFNDVLSVYSFYLLEETKKIAQNKDIGNGEKLWLIKNIVHEHEIWKYLK